MDATWSKLGWCLKHLGANFRTKLDHNKFLAKIWFTPNPLGHIQIGIVMVIAINAVCIGVSADQNPDSVLWEVLEFVFFGIYLLAAGRQDEDDKR